MHRRLAFAFFALFLAQAALAAPAEQPFTVRVVGHGPPVILIPGLGSSGAVWDATVEHLEATHQCHVLTLAGFAGTPAGHAPLLQAVREAVPRYIRAHHLGKVTIIGHSLGGFLAFAIASDQPELIDRVVAVDGVPFYSALFNPMASAEQVRPQAELFRQRFRAFTRAQLAAQAKQSAAMMVTSPADQAKVARWTAASDPATLADAMADLMSTDLRPSVKKITAPVLLLAGGGGLDAKLVQERYESQVAAIPHHRTVVVASRHFIMLDAPDRFFSLLDGFLGGQEQVR